MPPEPLSQANTKPEPLRFKPTSTTSSKPRRHPRQHQRQRQHTQTSPGPSLRSESAFRESLHDALADPEGAAFWAQVYGQPIHTFPRGQLDEEAYVRYVRRKLWEGSHEFIAREREREKKRRMRRRKEREKEERRDGRRERGYETSSRRKKHEKDRDGKEEEEEEEEWETAWLAYEDFWSSSSSSSSSSEPRGRRSRGKTGMIVWPTLSGDPPTRNSKSTNEEATDMEMDMDQVRLFFLHHPAYSKSREMEAVLKRERVKWHPDRMANLVRAGLEEDRKREQDEDVKTRLGMRMVTAVFQTIDSLYLALRETGQA